jgi:hypothetical protein
MLISDVKSVLDCCVDDDAELKSMRLKDGRWIVSFLHLLVVLAPDVNH